MTTDQTLTLLAIMVWPFVALVSCWSLYLTAQLVIDALVEYRNITRAERAKTITALYELVTDVLPQLPGLIHDRAPSRKMETAERAFLALLASNGGIPGRPKDETVRLLVHEVRKLYDELEHPTEPVRVDGGGDGGQDDDDLVSELFGSSFTDEDLDGDDGDRRGATAIMDEEI